ncbi:helix-turn-helix domain-containing protein [Limnohabitans sp.]|uniref:helix-turn-helix domain-containing protein n=1 Tax=Limnohabitans sp. TaxID=1907725 RepID=UPI003341E48C
MTEEIVPYIIHSTSAGALLRQYREAQGLNLEVLAHALRVAPAKLEALEADHLDELPDAMFARALALAVCRQLKVDAAPVLVLLPSQDVSRLAAKNERGLDFPLDRPSFLPQSNFLTVTRMFTPMRWAALLVLVLALMIGWWPEIYGLLVFKEEAAAGTLVVPVASQNTALPSTQEAAPAADSKSTHVVVTTVHSAAVSAQAASAAIPASASGVSNGK